ncbi:cysteine-rich DPF motif domain-containing protein 1 isoform X2 [Nannospalax galili]|uniref:cysteine-rich DPF motif domain-containing protein 1 isoform X2 n=1 Tax=Nannospalax galili TaxID=1026970 RepID=UPI00081A21F6|nr:cysteine-rich DPF motif domain-containing protein 1 isoform X2 [Nannospalax galili]
MWKTRAGWELREDCRMVTQDSRKLSPRLGGRSSLPQTKRRRVNPEAVQTQMVSQAEPHPLGMFECQLCALTAPYSYVGQKPPDTQAVVLLEESYIMKDPFSLDKAKFLVLGARCSMCGKLECSLFYSRRFCLPCVQENISAFPEEIQQDLKRRTPSQRPSSQP